MLRARHRRPHGAGDALRRAGLGRGGGAAARPDAAGGAPRRDAHARRAGADPPLLQGSVVRLDGGAARDLPGRRRAHRRAAAGRRPRGGGARRGGAGGARHRRPHASTSATRRSRARRSTGSASTTRRWRRCTLALHAQGRRARVAALAARGPRVRRAQALLAALPTLYGGPEVLARARTLVEDAGGARRRRRAGAAVRRLARARPGGAPVDRSRRGARLRLLHRHALRRSTPRAPAGRWPRAGATTASVARYGRPARAAGFALDVDRAAELLEAARRARAAADGRRAGGRRAGGGGPRWPPSCAPSGERAVLDLDEPAPRPTPACSGSRRRRASCARAAVAVRPAPANAPRIAMRSTVVS